MSKIIYDTNCTNYSQLPTILPAVDRIIAIGDVHGDMKLVIDSLVISKVIIPVKNKTNSLASKGTIPVKLSNKTYNYSWVGGKTIVVQIGDQNDSCRPVNGLCDNVKDDTPDDIPIFEFFTKLNELASKSGGRVYSLIGNHEIMTVQGDTKYTSNANLNVFNSVEERKNAFANGNQYANLLGCTRQSVLIIGDFLFIHAGINKYFLENFRGRDKLQKLNKLVKNWLLKKLDELQKMGMEDDTLNNLLNNADNSPFWNRILGQLPAHLPYSDPQCKELVAPILEAYKIKGMVIGHTPQIVDGINGTCGNKLFRIDVGASRAFESGREPQVLEIKKLNDKTYKYTVIFQKEEVYESIVPDDLTSFGRMESRLPN